MVRVHPDPPNSDKNNFEEIIFTWNIQTFIKKMVDKRGNTSAIVLKDAIEKTYDFELIEVIWSRREAQTVDA